LEAIMRTNRFSTAAAVATVAMAAACASGAPADKAGSETVVLKLASIDDVNSNGQSFGPQAFVADLNKLSGGHLKVEVTKEFGAGAADAESRLVKAIAAGTLDGGWPSTRAFAGAGINGLEVAQAPMLITSYAAEKALVTSPVAGELLAPLKGSGVVGLGLSVGPLRRPFAAGKPLLGPSDWAGAAFRVYNSPVEAEAVKALGATPANVGFEWVDQVRDGTLRGVEFDIAQYSRNGETTVAGNVTANVVLWPKMFVLSLSQKRFDSLSAEQQGWVREAAKQAVQTSVDSSYDETTPARALCTVGARFFWASPAQLQALRTSFKPVIDRLAADQTSGPALKQLQAIAAKFPDPLTPDVTDTCRGAGTAGAAASKIPTQVSKLPDGVFRQQVTATEVEAAGRSNNDGLSGTWTLTVRHGTYEVRCRPLGNPGHDCGNLATDNPVEVGDLRGIGAHVYFVPDATRLAALVGCKLPTSSTKSDHCGPALSYETDWKITGDELIFTGDAADVIGLGIKPYKKIG
jgi:TRAP-type C4-dicarboxylate transport system substrate-binding protein